MLVQMDNKMAVAYVNWIGGTKYGKLREEALKF